MPSEEQLARLALVKNILNIFCALSSQLRIYQQKNQTIRDTTSRLRLQLEKYFSLAEHLDFVVARQGFLYDDLFIDRSSVLLQKFANLIFMHGVAAIKLHSGVSEYELITFLRMIGRNPAEAGEEGGMRDSLELRRIDNIEIVELSEKDFQLLGEARASASEEESTDLWDRFARNLFYRQQGNSAETAASELEPADLARETSSFLAEQGIEEQQRFMREVTDFLLTLQQENNHAFRTKTLEKLTNYINHLSTDLKRLFLQNVFNFDLKEDFAEDFCSALSDDLIMEALQNAAKGKNYTPPVVLNLLGKLARSRELLPADSPLLQGEKKMEMEQKALEIFRSDEFEKYVPENYRHALLQILSSEEIDGGHQENLYRLKASLEEERLEEHTGQLIVYILNHNADECHLVGLFENLEKMIEREVMVGNFIAISEIIGLCGAKDDASGQALMRILTSPPLIASILDGAHQFGKEKYNSLWKLIKVIGPPFVDPILDRLADEKNRSIRFFYIECLKGLGATVAERASQRLGDQRWYYLRNILALLRELGDASQAEAIRPLFRHPHPKVQEEALKTGLFFRDPQAQRLLLEQLDCKDSGAVAVAVSLSRLAHDPRIFAKLSALLEKNALLNYNLDLKKGIIAALVKIDQRQALPILQRFLTSRNLLHPLLHTQFKRDITRTLEGLKPPRPVELRPDLSVSHAGENTQIGTNGSASMPGRKK